LKAVFAALSALLAVLYCANFALANTAEEDELAELNKIEAQLKLQREWIDYRWKKASAACYKDFFVTYCLKGTRADYRKEIDPVRDQEIALHESQRIVRDKIKDANDAKRAAERDDPAKAEQRTDNKKAFEQKQKDEAARAADLEQRRKDAPRRAQENKAGTQLD
jgi:hypothetical protein